MAYEVLMPQLGLTMEEGHGFSVDQARGRRGQDR